MSHLDLGAAVNAVNRIARFVDGAQLLASILANAAPTSDQCSASWCFGPAERFGRLRRTVSTGEPSARNSLILAHSSTADIAAPAVFTVACIPASATGRSTSCAAAVPTWSTGTPASFGSTYLSTAMRLLRAGLSVRQVSSFSTKQAFSAFREGGRPYTPRIPAGARDGAVVDRRPSRFRERHQFGAP